MTRKTGGPASTIFERPTMSNFPHVTRRPVKHRVILASLSLSIGLVMATLTTMSAMGQVQSPIIYPGGGQSLQQQSNDEAECRGWAQQQTGFNPAYGPQSPPPSSSQGGEVVRGAARGAALGAVGGAIAGNAGKGAAIGAGVGATAGLLGRRQKELQHAEAQQQAQDQYNSQLRTYNRAFGTCMQGRNYTVN